MIASVCIPGAINSCRPVWEQSRVYPAIDVIAAGLLLVASWVIIAMVFVGAAMLIEYAQRSRA